MTLGSLRWAALLLAGLMSTPVWAATVLQCVPYARSVSGVEIYGDALTWWQQAESQYKRGNMPKKGAVLAFRPSAPMVLGHVAVVSKVLDDRQVLLRHANWSEPGAIEEDVLAIDVSTAGDWSAVRVWHSPTNRMGARTNPTFGFIYPDRPQLRTFRPDPTLVVGPRYAGMNGAELKAAEAKATGRNPAAVSVADARQATSARKPSGSPRLAVDSRALRYADATPSSRTLRDIIADVKRDARLR